MDSQKKIRLINRSSGPIGYTIPDTGVTRSFPRPFAYKDVTFGELEDLSMSRGGLSLISKYILITDKEALTEILGEVEPEYYYTAKEIKEVLESYSQDAFLDFLDFAPEGALDILKDLAVELELNDMNKRRAILEKLGLDISNNIEIKNTGYDGDNAEPVNEENSAQKERRVPSKGKARRVETPERNYTIFE